MSLVKGLTAACALVLIGGAAVAQEPAVGGHHIPQMVEGERLRPDGSFYYGGFSGSAAYRPYAVHLYELRREGAPDGSAPIWTPWAMRVSGVGSQDRQVEWADGRSCPNLYGVVAALADFSPPRFRSPHFQSLPPGAGWPGGAPMTLGAPPVAIWGYARQADGALMTMMITGADGLIADWVRQANAHLEPCWRSDPPDDLFPAGDPFPVSRR